MEIIYLKKRDIFYGHRNENEGQDKSVYSYSL